MTIHSLCLEQVVVRRAELAEQSREEEEMAARVEAEVSRRVAEAIGTEAIAARIEAKLKVGLHGAKMPKLPAMTLLTVSGSLSGANCVMQAWWMWRRMLPPEVTSHCA